MVQIAFLHLDFDVLEEARRSHVDVGAPFAWEHWVAEALNDLAAELAKWDT